MAAGALLRLRADIQADIDDLSSGQGAISREIEASLRGEAARALHDIAAITGSDSMRDAARRQEEIARLRLSRSTFPQSYEDVEGIGDVPGYVAHLAIQSAPTILQFMGGAAAGGRMALRRGLSKTAGRAAGGVAGVYPSSTGGVLSAQDEQAGQYDLPSAAALGAATAGVSVVGGPEAFIARGAIPRVALRSRAGRTAALGAGTAVTEGAEETAQQYFEEVGRSVVDPTHDVLGEEAQRRYREAAIGGATLGLAIGGAAGAVSGRPADRVDRDAPQEVPITETPDDTQPRDLLREFFGTTPQRQPDRVRQDIALQRGQGELFRPSEMAPLEQRHGVLESFGVPPVEPTQAPEPAPTPETTPEQGDMLAGTSVELAAEIGSEMTRAQVALEQDFSQEALVRELRVPNKNRADSFVTRLAANLSRALREDPEQAVELLNDLANRPNSVTRTNVLRRAVELVQDFEVRKSQFDADAGAARQLLEEQVSRERTAERAAQARRESRPGARVELPPAGSQTEQQIRKRNRQQALEEELPEANRRGEESIRRQSTVERRRLLKEILDDPETQNPTARFIRALRKAGYRRGITDEEARVIRRFEEVRDAFRDVEEPSGANELTPEVTGIPERTDSVQPQTSRVQQRTSSSRSRYAPENFQLEAPPSTDAEFDALERAAARRARRRGEVEPEPQPETRDRRQGELFTPKTGQPTRAAQGLPPQRRGAAFQLDMFTPTGRVSRRPGRSRYVPEDQQEVDETPTPRPRDRRQLELFTPTGRPTRAAQGLPPQRRGPRRGVEPAFEPASEPAAEPAPEPAPAPAEPDVRTRNLEAIREAGRRRAERSVDRALDQGVVDFEEGQQLYQLLDEGRVDEVNRRLAQAHRATSGQTGAAPTPTAEASRRAEAQARSIEQRDRTVERTDEDEDEGDGGPEELRFSERESDQTTPTTPEALSDLRELFGNPDRFDDLVSIHATEQDAINSGAATEEDFLGRVAQGFAKDGKAHLIAENIPQGQELAVFLHEVGAHLGLKKMIGNRNYLWVRQQVEQWAERNDDSVEARVGRWVRRRTENMSPSFKHDEIVAYAVEGLVNEGVTPETGGAAGNMFRRIWAAVKRSLRRLGFKDPNRFTGQDLVNLAFGAADLELRGQWHGTAADPRTFDDRFIGTGEGHAMFGWGHYLADLFATGEAYRKADSVRKFKRQDRGNLLRTITTVKDEELLQWEQPFYKQSKHVQEALMRDPELAELLPNYPGLIGQHIYFRLAQRFEDTDPRYIELQNNFQRAQEAVKNAERQGVPEDEYERLKDIRYRAREELLDYQSRGLGQKGASQYLDSLGVKGNKFLDQGSRSRGKGTFNYVIFNARNIVRVHSRPGGDPTRMRFSDVSRLDMSPSARRARAEAMGFNTKEVLYHGSSAEFDAFEMPDALGDSQSEPAIWLTPDRRVADEHANEAVLQRGGESSVVALYARPGKQLTVTAADIPGIANSDGTIRFDRDAFDDVLARAREEGYDSVRFRRVKDLGPAADQIAIFDPVNVRSVDAAFDPTRADRPGLRFSEAAPSVFQRLADRVKTWVRSRNAENDLERYNNAFTMNQFYNTRFTPEPGKSITLAQAYSSYHRWASETGRRPMTMSDLADWFRKKGHKVGNIQGFVGVEGLTLSPEEEFAEAVRGVFNTRFRNNVRPAQMELMSLGPLSEPANDPDAETGAIRRQQVERAQKEARRQLLRVIKDENGPRFSEASSIPIESARNEAEKFGISLKTTLDDYAKKGVQMAAFGRDLRDMFERALPSFRGFFDTLTEKQAVMLNLGAEINNIMNDAQEVTGAERMALNSFLMKSTKSQKWGFKPDWQPDAQVDPEMQREFNGLTAKARDIAKRVFRHGHEILQRKNAVVQQLFRDALKEVDEENIPAAEKKKLKAKIMRQNNLYDETFRGMKGPYAPLERFGNYVTVAKSAKYRETERALEGGEKGARAELDDLKQDPNHYAVFFSDTMGDAEVKRRELQATGKFDLVDRFEKEAFYKTIQEAPWTALLRLKNMVSELAVDKDREKQLGYINSLLRDLYLASLSEASARKHDLKRQNIEGADPDMMRAFAAKGKADAHFIAALMKNGEIIKAMNAMRSEAAADTTPGGVPKADRRRALNEALHRHAQSFEWDQSVIGGLQDKAMALTSFWFLATSPRYYIQNFLQVPMVSLPTMAGRFGMAQSWGQLQRAYRDMVAGFESWREGLRGNYDIDALRIAPDEKRMLHRLRDTGLLDVGMNFDLGYWESTADTGISSKVAKVNHAFRTIARQVEVINRVSTALAAYRLQRQKTPGRVDPETGMDNDAYKMADSMVSQTHGDYSHVNKSRLFQSLPRMITQFRTYQMIQLSLIARYAYNAFKGEDAETRAIGRRTLAYILGQHAVVTGMLGLPAVQAVAYVMALAFGPDDEPADGERFLRRIIGDDTYANFLLKGVPAGMGLDVSKYIGMGEATSLMPFTDIDLSSREGYAETAVGMMGPFVSGVLPNMIDGMNQIRQGDYYKGLETTMPSGIRAGMRALRLATEGQSNRRGDQLLSPDEISAFDIAAQALNFETTKLQELRRKRSDLYEYEQYFRSRSSELKRRYTRAFKDKDREEMRELREEWRNLQAARRRTGFKVQPLSSLTRAPAEQRKRERNTRQGLQFNTGNRRFVEELTR